MPKDATQQLLETVINGAFKSVTDLAKATAEVIGDDKVQEDPAAA